MTTFPLVQISQESDLALLLEDLSQSEKLYEIKPPLDREKYVIM